LQPVLCGVTCQTSGNRGHFREESVKIRKGLKLWKNMTTAYGMHPTFSGRRPNIYITSDLYQVTTEIVEVHTDIARNFLSPLDPCYLEVRPP